MSWLQTNTRFPRPLAQGREISHFKENDHLILKNELDPRLRERAVDLMRVALVNALAVLSHSDGVDAGRLDAMA